MSNPKKKPNFDPELVMKELLQTVVDAYVISPDSSRQRTSIRKVAEELELSQMKVQKLLITAGIRDGKRYYYNSSCSRVLELYQQGKTVKEITAITGLKQTAVCCYLPYTKAIYNVREVSLNAQRIHRYRTRKKLCAEFRNQISSLGRAETEEYLWDTIEQLQGCVFRTKEYRNKEVKEFRYKVRGDEMCIDRNSKSITRASVMFAFNMARRMQQTEGCVSEPNKLGVLGAGYLYAIFLRLGICTAEPMTGTALDGRP